MQPERTGLLGPEDPPPFELINPKGEARLVFFCDHGGRAFPKALGHLGVSNAALEQHIAWDIGIAKLARRLSAALNAPAALATYSRLVIDCNRRLNDPTSIPQESDRIPIPGNRGLSAEDRAARAQAIFQPYHHEVSAMIRRKLDAGVVPAVISLAQFHAGDERFSAALAYRCSLAPGSPDSSAADGAVGQRTWTCVGDNEPYSGRDEHGYSVIAHAETLGLPHALIEVRQDLIAHDAGVAHWASVLERVFRHVLADDGLYRRLAS